MENIKQLKLDNSTRNALKKTYQCQSPVLFLVFNRPDVTARVFEVIRKVKPPRLYISADGPRPDREGEGAKCEEVRKIATTVDWDCEVETLFRNKNHGCKKAVSSGISWFFKNEAEGIILEDDCLPVNSFFRFCDSQLEEHRNDQTVWSVGGTKFKCYPFKESKTAYRSEIFFCWGWATWKSRWDRYSENLDDMLPIDYWSSKEAKTYWEKIINCLHKKDCDSWGYYFSISCIKQRCNNIVPPTTLVENLGFNKYSTHTAKAPIIYAGNVKDFKLADAYVHKSAKAYDRIYYGTFSQKRIKRYFFLILTVIIYTHEKIIKKF